MVSIMTMLLIGLTTATTMAGASRPFVDEVPASSLDKLMLEVCSAQYLICSNFQIGSIKSDDVAKYLWYTINDLQEDFFVESSLVEGRMITLKNNLHDPAPTRDFLSSVAANALPALRTYNTLSIMKQFGVAQDSSMATSVATAAYLCGGAALPGEARSCATSAEALAAFVAAELGNNVNVHATKGAPTSTSTSVVRALVTIVKVVKGSVEEGKKVVICHHLAFPSSLYYCHRVIGTKVVQTTLKTKEGSLIKGMAICHLNTKLWLSRHPAFKALNIARGDEACHFLVENDIIFTRAMGQNTLA
ncbi:hypothetical protein KC19_3G135600 [Ceratodon purpureus]|uniref:BURP domain-containing protein n=1 Tax=Ceratodon purpureus TaxID=3225 RepID=A0A8T0ILJ1_CERPU|nr:hypothetical protein KC19_3G135600 [Ceratodon purpureus]